MTSMTPAQIIALIRDCAIVGALCFILWKIYGAGVDSVKLADMKAVQTQLQTQQRQIEAYAQQVNDANAQRSQDTQAITAAIAAHQQPVIVRLAPSPNTVPAVPIQASSAHPESGGIDAGRGIDLRPAIAAFELKYEQALADCRLLDNSWPTEVVSK